MYSDHYKFSGLPFQLTPDSRFFFESHVHSRAMGFLNYGIMHGEGYVVITGEVGAGKTTLVEHLLSGLSPQRYLVGKIVTTQLGGDDMLRMVGAAFDVFKIGMDKSSLLMRIKQLLTDLHANGRRALLVVDEAQSLSKEALEELRMLSNLTVSGGSPIQGVLLGQPEFRRVLGSPELEQLRQRVIASYHLGALGADDTKNYIEHRLNYVGWDRVNPFFSEGAFAEIYRYTGGIPRKINTLCSRILLLGFVDEKKSFNGDTVARVAKELASEVGLMETDYASAASNPSKFDGNALVRSESAESNVFPRLEKIEEKLGRHERLIQRVLKASDLSEQPSDAPKQPISKFR